MNGKDETKKAKATAALHFSPVLAFVQAKNPSPTLLDSSHLEQQLLGQVVDNRILVRVGAPSERGKGGRRDGSGGRRSKSVGGRVGSGGACRRPHGDDRARRLRLQLRRLPGAQGSRGGGRGGGSRSAAGAAASASRGHMGGEVEREGGDFSEKERRFFPSYRGNEQ